MSAIDDPITTLLGRLQRVRETASGWQASCPGPRHARGDVTPSLSITLTEDRVLIHCFVGCTPEEIVTAVKMALADLFLHPVRRRHEPDRTYDYRDETGVLLYQVVRYDVPKKDFRQRRPDGRGGWIWKLTGVERVLYRLPELQGRHVVAIAEGEKDADALAALGIAATTHAGGARKWRDEYTSQLVGARVRSVVIFADHDAPGATHARQVARACLARGLRVKLVEFPELPEGGDVSDWLAAGHSGPDLRERVAALPWLTSADEGGESPGAEPMEDTATTWPPPEAVQRRVQPVPAFDPDRLLPPVLRPWVCDIAERMQCPIDYVAIAAMVAIGALIGRQLTIRPKREDDWTVVPNLWALIVGRPGQLKSPAVQEVLKPLHRLARQAHDEYVVARKAAEAEREAAKLRQETIKSRLKRTPTAELAAAFAAATAVVDAPMPTERRYLVNDATVEKLGVLLNENPAGLLLYRDELAGFLRTMEREGHENDRAFFCEAWAGTGGYTYDRIGRGTLHIAAACVSILGTIQPGPLAAYLTEACGVGRGDDGLIQRMQLAVYPDPPAGPWRNVDRYPNREAKTRVTRLFEALACLDARAAGAEQDELDPEAPPFLHFTILAQVHFDRWRARLEAFLRKPDEEHPVLVSHLSKYRSLIPALALVVHLIETIESGHLGNVSPAAVEVAIAWGAYLEAHARRLYHSVSSRGDVAAAVLAKRLQAGKLPDPFTMREVLKHGWGGLTTRDETLSALDTLEGLSWIRAHPVTPGERGGRPTIRYHINPRVRAEGVIIEQILAEGGFDGFGSSSIGPSPSDFPSAESADMALPSTAKTAKTPWANPIHLARYHAWAAGAQPVAGDADASEPPPGEVEFIE